MTRQKRSSRVKSTRRPRSVVDDSDWAFVPAVIMVGPSSCFFRYNQIRSTRPMMDMPKLISCPVPRPNASTRYSRNESTKMRRKAYQKMKKESTIPRGGRLLEIHIRNNIKRMFFNPS